MTEPAPTEKPADVADEQLPSATDAERLAAKPPPAPPPAAPVSLRPPATRPGPPTGVDPRQHPHPPPPGAPVRPSVLRRRWPAPTGNAPLAVVAAAAAAAAVGAVSIPLDRPGLGWLVGVVAGTAALGVAAWFAVRPGDTGTPDRTGTARRSPLSAWRLLWTAATVALIGVGTVRAAGWLFALCVLTAGVTAGLAVSGGRSMRALLLGCVIPPVAVVRSLPWSIAGLTRFPRGGGSALGRTSATIGVSLALLVVFGALFSSADAAFASLLDEAVPDVSVDDVARWALLFPALAAGLLGGALLLAAPPDLTGLESPGSHRLRQLEWAVPVALLDALFVAFVLVQVTHLFGGSDHVLATTGLTYAEYARGGFWQLLAVSALTVLVIAAAGRWAPREDRADRALIRLLLGTLALLSLVVVASALFRMNVYQQAYGFTRLRVLVSAAELWLGLLFVLVLVAGIRLRAAWLPRLVVASAVLALLGLAGLNPDRFIADRNIDRYLDIRRLDVWYLSDLSPDAVPALDRLPAPLRACAVRDLAGELSRSDDSWREWNLARARARRLLADQPAPDAQLSCGAVLRGVETGGAPGD